MEVEIIPEPDEFGHHDEDDQNRRLQFSLHRGYSVQEPSEFCYPALSCRRRSIERILGPLPLPVASSASKEDIIKAVDTEDVEPVEPRLQTRRATISAGATLINPYKKRMSNMRDWPYGEPKIRNDDDYFEVEFRTGPFKPEEVFAKVVGKELIIHCKPDPDLRHAKEGIWKEIFRSFPLPLSAPPLASDVSILKDNQWIRIAIRKESPLNSPLGIYTPEMAEVIQEETQKEVDDETDDEERMDGD